MLCIFYEPLITLLKLKLFVSAFLDDHSRVVLKSMKDIAGSDYINANYVDVR